VPDTRDLQMPDEPAPAATGAKGSSARRTTGPTERATRLGNAAAPDGPKAHHDERGYLSPRYHDIRRCRGTADEARNGGNSPTRTGLPVPRRDRVAWHTVDDMSREPATRRCDTRRRLSWTPEGVRVHRPVLHEGGSDVHRKTDPSSEDEGTSCSQRDAAGELGKLDFRALLPSRIRTPVAPVRHDEGRCSLGLPPLQGFPPQNRATAFTGAPLTGFAAAPARRPYWRLPHRVLRLRGWLVSFETAAPLEVSHLVA
jgi:hypothetical protein